MKLTNNLKLQIKDMSYVNMLKYWRFHPAGDPLFQDESGEYFTKQMKEKRKLLGNSAHIAASKQVGWDK